MRQVGPTRRFRFVEAKATHDEGSEPCCLDLQSFGESKTPRPQTDRPQCVTVQLERLHASKATILRGEGGEEGKIGKVNNVVGEKTPVCEEQRRERGEVV